MLKRIFALERLLKSVGANKEADELIKLAHPMIDAISIEGTRTPSIAQSSRQDWFDSIKLLKDNIVLIHFNRATMGTDSDRKDFLEKLSLLFSGKKNTPYNKIKKEHSVLSEDLAKDINSNSPDFSLFKKIFPKAATEAESSLSKAGLTVDDAIFFIYNEYQEDRRETKTAPYFAHDLGHISFDVFKSTYQEFMSDKIYDILSLYKRKASFDLRAPKQFDPNAVETLSSTLFRRHIAFGSVIGDQFLKKAIVQIFSNSRKDQDAGYDLIALCANPNQVIEITIPDELRDPRDNLYTISEEDKPLAKNILTDMLNKLKEFLSQEQKPEEYLEYLLDNNKNKDNSAVDFLPEEMKGKVFLMELF